MRIGGQDEAVHVQVGRNDVVLFFEAENLVLVGSTAAEAAGVLFTREPNTGNPSKILITANFGLGEVRLMFACLKARAVASLSKPMTMIQTLTSLYN